MTDGYHDCRSRHDLPVGRNVGESTFRGDDMRNPNSSQFGHSFNTIQPTKQSSTKQTKLNKNQSKYEDSTIHYLSYICRYSLIRQNMGNSNQTRRTLLFNPSWRVKGERNQHKVHQPKHWQNRGGENQQTYNTQQMQVNHTHKSIRKTYKCKFITTNCTQFIN